MRGGFHADAKSLNARFNVTVTCLSIEGNRAWIGGIISDSDTPLVRPGLASYFYVIDVGEGAIGAIQQDIVSALRPQRRAWDGADLLRRASDHASNFAASRTATFKCGSSNGRRENPRSSSWARVYGWVPSDKLIR